jgi:hypothetical protein
MTHYKQKISGLALLLTLLMNIAYAQEPVKKEKAQTQAAQAASNPVVGSGTPGRISKWTGVEGTNTYSPGNTNIIEDKVGKVGSGTTSPTSPLTVRGMIDTTLGGYKFPDGTVQTTAFDPNQVVRSLNGLTGNVQLAAGANITITPSGNTLTIAAENALTGVTHDATLKGDGTPASPLEVHDLDNPGRQPFVIKAPSLPTDPGVPSGKRFVIDYISGFTQISPAFSQAPERVDIRVFTTTSGIFMEHYVIGYLVFSGTLSSRYVVSQQVRLFCDSGTKPAFASPFGGSGGNFGNYFHRSSCRPALADKVIRKA